VLHFVTAIILHYIYIYIRLAISSQLRHVSTVRKNWLNSDISSTCPHNVVNFGPTNGWNQLGSSGHPSNFQLVSHLGFLTALTSLNGSRPTCAQCLAVSWDGTLHRHVYGGSCT